MRLPQHIEPLAKAEYNAARCTSMGSHSQYGKKVMAAAVGSAFVDWGSSVDVNYGCGPPAHLDGVIGSDIAVEIESRVSKQVRGAVCDLIFHQFPKKLLIIEPVHMTDPESCAEQCRNILRRFVHPKDFRVVVLSGSGWNDHVEADAACIRNAVTELRTESAVAASAI